MTGSNQTVFGTTGPLGRRAECCLSRRGFLAACATCVAGATGLAPGTARAITAAAERRKPRIRLVFSYCAPGAIRWPNIGEDCQTRAHGLLNELKPLCPEVEFLPVHALDAEDAAGILASDSQCDGYLVWLLEMGGGGMTVIENSVKRRRPVIVVEDHYAGPCTLGFNGRAEQGGWKALSLSTSRMQDVADVVHCFQSLQRPSATADDFLAAAKAAYRKNIAPMGDMTCAPDPAPLANISQCLEQLRSTTILNVGRPPNGLDKAIAREFGARVLTLPYQDLQETFRDADPAEAAKWADRWIGAAEKVVEPKRDEVVRSGAMHAAMQELLASNNAQAIAINCLEGFRQGSLPALPCLGFVELNNNYRVGACEADLASAITMLAMGYLTGRPGFISDPVIDTSKNQVIYVHCMAPIKVFGPDGPSNPYQIRSHSNDWRGAVLRSLLPLGYMTTTMQFLPGRRQAVLHQGKAIANIGGENARRTKLAVELNGDIDKLYANWTADWHRVTFYGDLKDPARELCKALDLTLIEEA